MENIILLLTILTAFFITGNNSSILIGPYISVSSLKKIASVTVLLGILAGFLGEGYKLRKFIFAFGESNYFVLSITLIIIIFLLWIANKYKLPISLTMLLAGSIVGDSFLSHTHMDITYLGYLAIVWIFYPVLGLIFANIIYITIHRINERISWKGYKYEETLLIISTFFISYVFGANTLGLLNSIVRDFNMGTSILILLSAILGYLFLFNKVSIGVGLSIYNIGITTLLSTQFAVILLVEAATQYGIPVSLTQLWILSFLGPGLTKEIRLINRDYIKKIVILWSLSPLIGATIPYIIFYILKFI